MLGNPDILVLLWTGSCHELDFVASDLDAVCPFDIWRIPVPSIGDKTCIRFRRSVLQLQWHVLGLPRHGQYSLLLCLLLLGLVYGGASDDDIHHCADQEQR